MVKATKLELKSLYEAADEFERLQPWEWISEYQLLVVEDPETHIMGFCCIIGNKSDERGLKVYLGIDGLRHYIEMLDFNQLTIKHLIVFYLERLVYQWGLIEFQSYVTERL